MKPLPVEQWDPSLQHIIDDMGGQPINVHCLLANHPTLLKAWWNYRMYLVQGGDLAQRDTEIVILRVAVHMKAWYEWAAHVDRGLAAGLTVTEIERIAVAPNDESWSAQDRALLHGVDSLVCDRGLSSDIRQTLENHFSEQQILDVIWLQGLYVTIASVIATWPIQIEAAVVKRIPPQFTEQAFFELLSAADGD